MNIAIITAGGVGSRMNQDIPKQFMNINNNMLLSYTLLKFQMCSEIDGIVVSCLDGWQNKVDEIVNNYGISKLLKTVKGGETGQDSIYNAYKYIRATSDDNDIVLIHDGNRPMVSNEIIHRGIDTCRKYGNAVAYVPCQEAVLYSDDLKICTKELNRDKLARAQTPMIYYVKDLEKIYSLAFKKNIKNCVAMCSMCEKLGIKSNLYLGSEKNIKITTPDDITIFKALLEIESYK